ncbi:hypothetical protein PHPALM_29324, partial [Phytophthora palmivora]
MVVNNNKMMRWLHVHREEGCSINVMDLAANRFLSLPRRLEAGSYVFVFLSSWLQVATCWRQWTWNVNASSPTARRGHSFVTYDNQLVVFGGRTEDTTKTHVPK